MQVDRGRAIAAGSFSRRVRIEINHSHPDGMAADGDGTVTARGHGQPIGAMAALRWLTHPVTIALLVVLLVNDHVLKSAWPGPVTGKLSDVAGLVLAPPLLATLGALIAPGTPVRVLSRSALAVTGCGFTIIKSSAYAAHAASIGWSTLHGASVIRADRTDLLALPALAIAWLTLGPAEHRPGSRYRPVAQGSDRAPGRTVRDRGDLGIQRNATDDVDRPDRHVRRRDRGCRGRPLRRDG